MQSVNTKHDAAVYERCRYPREICEMSDANLLYDSFLAAMKSSAWKTQVQQFEMNHLIQIAGIQRELRERDYHFLPGTQFIMNERGKTRYISNRVVSGRSWLVFAEKSERQKMEEDTDAMMVDHEFRLTMLELGI